MKVLIRLAIVALVFGAAWYVRGGFGDVGDALSMAGWGAVAAVTAFHLVPLVLCGAAWSLLTPGTSVALFVVARWVRDGVGELAGFVPLSGEVAGVRLLNRRGLSVASASAMTVVDISAEVVSQFVFSLIGVGLWMWLHPHADVVRWGQIGLAVSLPVLVAFIVVQRSLVMRFVETLPARVMPKTWQCPDAESGIHANVNALWRNRGRVALASATHLTAWLASTGEAWLALRFLGHPLPVLDVVALESVIYAIRSAVFVIPAAIGVQEGGYLLIGAALGLPPHVCLAVSLLKRGRELILGIPAVCAWQIFEGRKRPSVN